MRGQLNIVGIGPGNADHMTRAAIDAIMASEVLVGYKSYIALLGNDLLEGKELYTSSMKKETERAAAAIDFATSGKIVSMISSGDAGIYGMAGLLFELLEKSGWRPGDAPAVQVIPGISAMGSVASRLGAPLMHDFAVISLSDLLTPWDLILKRIKAAAAADFVIALYNPASKKRTGQIVECREILLQNRKPQTPVGLVSNCFRENEKIVVTNLEKMLEHEISMTTTVIIGNSESFILDNLIVTPRGYQLPVT